MYNIIKKLCNEHSISLTQLARNLRISPSLFTELKSGRTKSLSAEKVSKIADYFDVSVDYLLGIEDKKSPVNIDGLSDNRKKLMEFVETVPEDKAEMILRVMKSILQDN